MKTLLQRLNSLKIFNNQPNFTEQDFIRLVDLGLIVSETFKYDSERRTCEVSNRNPGDVVSYTLLANALKLRKVSQDDARRLIMVETIRANGRPRQSHFARLMHVAFTADKENVFQNIEKICNVRVR